LHAVIRTRFFDDYLLAAAPRTAGRWSCSPQGLTRAPSGCPGRPGVRLTAWLAEGLLLYLTAEEATALLTDIGDLAAPGSQLSFEHASIAGSALFAQARTLPGMDPYAALWKGGLGENAPAWLASHGWQSRFHDRTALAAAYGRPVAQASDGGFLTAVRTA
jgi:O-methyltransferase involved in polyketide biosynthesis